MNNRTLENNPHDPITNQGDFVGYPVSRWKGRGPGKPGRNLRADD